MPTSRDNGPQAVMARIVRERAAKEPSGLTRCGRYRNLRLVHELVCSWKWLNDRLRCPSCGKVGTFKAHGGWVDSIDARGVRRWLCKWCGYYESKLEGVRQCGVDLEKRVWALDQDLPIILTPQSELARSLIHQSDPWRG